MLKFILKWLASLGTGAALVGLAYVTGHLGSGPDGVDPLLATLVAGAVAKFVSWLTSKIPV